MVKVKRTAQQVALGRSSRYGQVLRHARVVGAFLRRAAGRAQAVGKGRLFTGSVFVTCSVCPCCRVCHAGAVTDARKLHTTVTHRAVPVGTSIRLTLHTCDV